MASSNPWMKFYPRDWRGDQALRAVGIAARGLWMECLCIMHEAKPYGHLLLNGEPVEADALARMTGASVDEVSALMAELRQAGVLSVTGKGVVFSRRMTKDHARAQKGRKAARERWAQRADKERENESPNGYPNGSPITQKPEAREERVVSEVPNGTSETCPKPPKRRCSYPSDFEEFWNGYPTDKNMAKKEAFAAWRRISEDERRDAIASLPGFNSYCQKNPDYRVIHANRYLLKGRFEGHLQEAAKLQNQTIIYPETPEWRAWIAYKQAQGARTAFMEAQGREGKGFPVPSRFPPTASAA